MAEAIGGALQALADRPGAHVGSMAALCSFSSTNHDPANQKLCGGCCSWAYDYIRRSDKLLSATTDCSRFAASLRQRQKRNPVLQRPGKTKLADDGAKLADDEALMPPPSAVPRRKQAWKFRTPKPSLKEAEAGLDGTGRKMAALSRSAKKTSEREVAAQRKRDRLARVEYEERAVPWATAEAERLELGKQNQQRRKN
jgi:hypothetical protein